MDLLRLVLVAGALAACGAPSRVFDQPADGGTPVTMDGGTTDPTADVPPLEVGAVPHADVPPSLDNTIVYAHSDSTLYAVNPRTNGFSTVGMFTFPAGDTLAHGMTDLAVDAMGGVVGTTQNGLWQINPGTAACTLLAPLPSGHTFVGLTYIPAGALDPSAEVLVGGASDGTYWRIDPTTGNVTQIGTFQSGWHLSGDIVSVAGGETWATVRRSSGATDSLATLDPATGVLTIVGDTHYHSIYGLAYWRSTLYGFTTSGQFITINSTTGMGHLVSTPVMQFYGAGVTTLAPTAPP